MKVKMAPEAWAAVEAHVREGYPHETCGILLGRAEGQGPIEILEAHACSNAVTERAHDRYLLEPKDQLRIEKDARLRALEVVGYYHSHPDHPAQASATDLEQSWERFYYLIVSVREGRVADRKMWVRGAEQLSFEEVALAGVPAL